MTGWQEADGQLLGLSHRTLGSTCSELTSLPLTACSLMTPCVGRMIAPKDVYILNLKTCAYVTLRVKRDVAEMIDFEMRLSWIIEMGQM